jgi:hypothetical protein
MNRLLPRGRWLEPLLVWVSHPAVLPRVLQDPGWATRLTAEGHRALPPLLWGHVNPYGSKTREAVIRPNRNRHSAIRISVFVFGTGTLDAINIPRPAFAQQSEWKIAGSHYSRQFHAEMRPWIPDLWGQIAASLVSPPMGCSVWT